MKCTGLLEYPMQEMPEIREKMEDYAKSDQYIHQLSQLLAKTSRSLVPAKEDDSHTNLYWDPLQQQLLGRWVPLNGGFLLPGLNFEQMEFQWLDRQMEVVEKVSLVGKNYFEAEKLVEGHAKDVGIDTESLMVPLHFEIPDYSFKNSPINKLEEKKLLEWSYYRSLANHILKDLGEMVQRKVEVRIWPHHFDTGIYFQWNNEFGIGCGLAMEDKMAGAPYFYISAYTGHDQIDYTNATSLSNGKWIKEGPWKGGILPLNELESDIEMKNLMVFYKQALYYLLKGRNSRNK